MLSEATATIMKDNMYDPDYVRGLFNRMSSSYERVNYVTSFGFSIRWRSQFLKSFKPTGQKAEIIDLMTGMGETWAAIKHKLPHANLTVLDFSEGMLKYASQKSKDKFDNSITVLQQNVLQSDLPSNHFDFVTCAFGLKTFNDEQLQALARETGRILKPGGQFSFIEVSKPDHQVLNSLYGFYVGRMIPILGKLLLGSPEEYKMLWNYTKRFENAKKAADYFTTAGLATEYTTYFYGCASGFCGSKPIDFTDTSGKAQDQ